MDGVLPIRVQVPEGKQTTGITAIDGTMGQIMRAYLDWRLSGNDAWLRACAEMALACGEKEFAEKCRDLFSRGSRWIDDNLFNGEYYIQKVRGIPVKKTAKPLISRGGAEDPLNPDLQAGEGCLADQLVGR